MSSRDPFRIPARYPARQREEENEDEADTSNAIVIIKPAAPATDLTPKLADELIQMVNEGMTIEDAGKFLMVHPTTLRSWLRAGEGDPTSEYGWFATRLRQAQAVFVKEMVVNVRRAAKTDGNVALKVLEKAARGDWGPNNTSEVNVKGTIVHEHVGQELARIVENRKAIKAQIAENAPQAPVQGEYREEDK